MDVFALATRIESTGGQQVMRELDAVDRVGRRTAQGFGAVSTSTRTLSTSFGGMSAVLQDVARDFAITGSIGNREFKQLAREGTELALLLGAGGPVVAAAGLVGLTIATSFGRAADEARKMRIKIIDEFEQLVSSTQMTDIAARTSTETEKLRQQLAELADREAQLTEIPLQAQQSLLEAGKGVVRQNTDRIAAEQRINALKGEIAITELNITRLQERQNALAYEGAATDRIRATEKARQLAIEERRRAELEIISDLERKLSSLEDVRPTLAPTFDLTQLALDIEQRGIRIPIPATITFPNTIAPDVAEQINKQAAQMAQGLEAGITEALSGLFTGDVGKSLLAGLGTIMIQFGQAIIPFGKLLAALQKWLTSNPLGAGVAAVAIGAAMIALGSALRGAAGGRGGGGGFSGGGIGRQEDTSRFTLGTTTQTVTSGSAQTAAQLSPVRPVAINNPTFIGADSPRAQREVVELIRNAALRGMQLP